MIGTRDTFFESYELRWDAVVDFALERQIGQNWCWAAVAKGIVDHYGGPTRKQCQYATKFLKQKKTCCGRSAFERRCDVEHDVDSVLAHYGNYAGPVRGPIGLERVRRELERDRPVVALVRDRDSAHAVVITAVDIAHRRIGVCDPSFGSARTEYAVDRFTHAYDGEATWFYTILTRPAPFARAKATISPLYDTMRQPERRTAGEPVRSPSGKPLEIEIEMYHADPFRLADGTGLQTAERVDRAAFRLDVFATNDGSLRIDQELTQVREEIWARLDRGFEVRIVRCHAAKLRALWFTDPADPSHRTDHYLPFGPQFWFFDEVREYSAAETREIFAGAAKRALPSIAIQRTWIERLDRETALQPDDPAS